uniref:Uncharacterized protein n=1 Tax=Mesocestoides corti TaxID=53468 RepID=A0A5K3FVR8_MESCO
MPLEPRETRDWLRPGGPTCLRPDPTPHHTQTGIASDSNCHGLVKLFPLAFLFRTVEFEIVGIRRPN